jgi:hypothetical protein
MGWRAGPEALQWGPSRPAWGLHLAGGTTGPGRKGCAAAGFFPLRRWVQNRVDRRFNRRRYHAARTVAGFATRLREQVDLDALTAELLAVVDQTMQPVQASLWLRPPANRLGR